jgi:hypothetical protein
VAVRESIRWRVHLRRGGGCDNAATGPDAFCDQGFSNADIGV